MEIRIGIHKLYYKIALEHQLRYYDLNSQYEQLETQGIVEEELEMVSDKMYECYTNREQAAVIVVTFSCMCLEAFIYDYAAEILGDSYVKGHLDKLDLASKIVLYPRIVAGREFDKSNEAYAKLRELVKLRNYLVHFKSKKFDLADDKAIDLHSKLNQKLSRGVDDSPQVVRLVMAELDRLHGNKYYSTDLEW